MGACNNQELHHFSANVCVGSRKLTKSTSLGEKEPDVIEENLSEAADIDQPQKTGPDVKVNGCINEQICLHK